MSISTKDLDLHRKLSLITIGAVYLLILVGGIVRSSGAGMGCPDWPKCFGSWIPPTSASQLPENYKEIYSEKRHQKNVRFAWYLEVLGMDETAEKLLNDPAVREEADFIPAKTWIEYMNRLTGVVIGFLIMATFLYSLKFRKEKPLVFWLSFLAFAGVVFQGWIGSIVVSTNLLPGMISFHMLLALVIVMLLIGAYYYAAPVVQMNNTRSTTGLQWLLLACALIFLVQMVVGIRVRESVDAGLSSGVSRTEVLEWTGGAFLFHRSFSWLLLIGHLAMVALLWKADAALYLRKFAGIIAALVVVEVITGAAMGYLAIPAFIQPLHLLVASLIFGFQVYLFLLIKGRKESIEYGFE